jgi:plasmid stabilization system protein ParE
MSEIVVLLGADSDLIKWFGRFEDWRPGLGFDFDRDFRKACDRLSANPLVGPQWRQGFRRLLIRRWNLGIFYEVRGKRVLIHGILDLRQNPDEIEKRLGLR